MSLSDRKLEAGIIGLSVVMLVGMGYLLKAPVQSVISGQDVGYEMPRPKKSFFASLFDLGDREVDRKYINPFDKKAEAKKAEVAKKEEPKKIEPPKPQLKALAKATPAKADRKAQVSVTVVGETQEAKKWGADNFFAKGKSSQWSAPGSEANSGDNNIEEQNNKMSGDQWRALLSAQPTQENMFKLISAFSRQEVDIETYFMITTDLFRSNRSENQELALMAMRSYYSPRSFELTSQFIYQLPEDLRESAHSYLSSYAAGNRLNMLATILKGGEGEAVYLASQIVLEGYLQAKAGGSMGGDPRNLRGDGSGASINTYSQFVPIFQALASSSDANLANLANNALNQMQSTVAAL